MNTKKPYALIFLGWLVCSATYAGAQISSGGSSPGNATSSGNSGAPALGPIDKTVTNSHRRGEPAEDTLDPENQLPSNNSDAAADRRKQVARQNAIGASRMTDAMDERTKSDLGRQKSGIPASK